MKPGSKAGRREIVLLRHGKSDWSAAFDHDRDRPLAPRGIEASRRVGRFLARRGARPSHALVSPARRTRQTYELAARAGAWSMAVEQPEEMYETDGGTLLELLRRQPPERESVLLVGHEPSLSELVARLTGGRPPRVPTAATLGLRWEGSWKSLGEGGAQLRWLLPAKLLAVLDADLR